jgi:hypothetical protein
VLRAEADKGGSLGNLVEQVAYIADSMLPNR